MAGNPGWQEPFFEEPRVTGEPGEGTVSLLRRLHVCSTFTSCSICSICSICTIHAAATDASGRRPRVPVRTRPRLLRQLRQGLRPARGQHGPDGLRRTPGRASPTTCIALQGARCLEGQADGLSRVCEEDASNASASGPVHKRTIPFAQVNRRLAGRYLDAFYPFHQAQCASRCADPLGGPGLEPILSRNDSRHPRPYNAVSPGTVLRMRRRMRSGRV